MDNAKSASGYHLVKRVFIGGEGGWDYLIVDNDARRLYVTHGTRVHVLNADTLAIVGEIPNTEGVHGVAIASEFGRGFTSNGRASSVSIFDLKSLKVIAQWPLAPGEEPSGLALDTKNNRLFSTCSNEIMIVMDAGDGHILASLPIGDGSDGCGFDPETSLVFSSNGEGTLSIIQEDSPTKFSVLDTVTTQLGARTMTIDPKTHSVFLPAAEFGPTPKPTVDVPEPRPSIIPDTFVLLQFQK